MISRRILAAAALLCALSAPAHAQSSAITINPTAGTTNQGLVMAIVRLLTFGEAGSLRRLDRAARQSYFWSLFWDPVLMGVTE
jgi:hypothetical protein